MSINVHIGKRIVALEDIALVEPFDPAAHPGMRSDKPFKSRVVLIDRQSVLTEEAVESFVKTHSFRSIPEDGIGVNVAMNFSVETFEPVPGFEPTKAFRSRLQWRDHDGNTQSKLLLTEAEALLQLVSKGREPSASTAVAPVKTGATRRRRRREAAPGAEPAPQ